ncbi:hypothetical protein [Microbacterium sp. PM5]|uniref:hypothetical protein n=1 Tax=Microbacterium sp. PM5 TaxID=2014534 RepID=UPI0013AFCE55|nr:hypothetical protein [Microbacterium sp. PM5]
MKTLRMRSSLLGRVAELPIEEYAGMEMVRVEVGLMRRILTEIGFTEEPGSADQGVRVRVHTHPLGEPCPPSCAHSSAGRESEHG